MSISSDDGSVLARCSLWWRCTPALQEQSSGFIGQFQAESDVAAEQLLNLACRKLAEHNVTFAIGPVDGNTWNRYRFVVGDNAGEAPFFLEPTNPPAYPQHFRTSGFGVIARYESSASNRLYIDRDENVEQYKLHMRRSGVTVRSLRITDFETELKSMHALSLVSFQNNFLFSPITLEGFLEKYLPLRAFVRPELVQIGERDGQMVGFNFVIPDNARADAVIVKTLARKPEPDLAGLGTVLLAASQSAAVDLGYRKVIHALYHEQNRSAFLSKRFAQRIREYALFAKALQIR
jgi:hypothetical protein